MVSRDNERGWGGDNGSVGQGSLLKFLGEDMSL